MENDKLKKITSTERPSGWMELPAYKKENRPWVDRSVKISLRVLEILDEKGMSQVDLAKLMGVTRQYVSRILNGTENFTLETVAKLEDALGVSLIEIIEQNTSVRVGKLKESTPEEKRQGYWMTIVLAPSPAQQVYVPLKLKEFKYRDLHDPAAYGVPYENFQQSENLLHEEYKGYGTAFDASTPTRLTADEKNIFKLTSGTRTFALALSRWDKMTGEINEAITKQVFNG